MSDTENGPSQTPSEIEDGEIEDIAGSVSDSGLHCLVMLAKYLERPANINQVRHARGKMDAAFDESDILISAKEIGLKARAIDGQWERLGDAIGLPAIAERGDGTYMILAKMNADKDEILVHDPLVGRPQKKSRAEIDNSWTGRLIVLTTRSLLAGGGAKFDVSWFI
ncbi:MAG: cysteine peptidase family C39 domain-containing protein, partial [Rhodospirillales bacterium]|nr:cysteine peptidase family C39 domain-containing protein [Rhodospirillales bacterium]